jgi:hypothetical protein
MARHHVLICLVRVKKRGPWTNCIGTKRIDQNISATRRIGDGTYRRRNLSATDRIGDKTYRKTKRVRTKHIGTKCIGEQ